MFVAAAFSEAPEISSLRIHTLIAGEGGKIQLGWVHAYFSSAQSAGC
jgi:hypothetical protein